MTRKSKATAPYFRNVFPAPKTRYGKSGVFGIVRIVPTAVRRKMKKGNQ
jgi:hypothetical protein